MTISNTPSCPVCGGAATKFISCHDDPDTGFAHNVYTCPSCGAVGVQRVWRNPGWTWVAADGKVTVGVERHYVPPQRDAFGQVTVTPTKVEPTAPAKLTRVISRVISRGGVIGARVGMRVESPDTPADAPPAAPTARPSPPTSRCTCAATSTPPRAHARSCPCYSVEDAAWCRTRWVDERTGQSPSYAEALEQVRREARCTCSISGQPYAHAADCPAKAEPAARCGACNACMGLTAIPLCQWERVATREEVRRLWCHLQALDGVQLSAPAMHVLRALRDEIVQLAARAGVA